MTNDSRSIKIFFDWVFGTSSDGNNMQKNSSKVKIFDIFREVSQNKPKSYEQNRATTG